MISKYDSIKKIYWKNQNSKQIGQKRQKISAQPGLKCDSEVGIMKRFWTVNSRCKNRFGMKFGCRVDFDSYSVLEGGVGVRFEIASNSNQSPVFGSLKVAWCQMIVIL